MTAPALLTHEPIDASGDTEENRWWWFWVRRSWQPGYVSDSGKVITLKGGMWTPKALVEHCGKVYYAKATLPVIEESGPKLPS